MLMIYEICQLLSAVLLGLLAGALWAEGALLVPYWKTLTAPEFYHLHPDYAPRLFRFFAPITAFTPAIAAVTAALGWHLAAGSRWMALTAALLAAGLIVIYFAYFSKTNAAFAKSAINDADLPAELNRWHNWHKLRVVICISAFCCSILSIYLR